MFGIGPLELLVIVVALLIFVGPQRLPEVMRQAGRFFVQARRMTSEARSVVDDAIRKAEDDLVREERDELKKLLNAAPGDNKQAGTVSRTGDAIATKAAEAKPSEAATDQAVTPALEPEVDASLRPEGAEVFEAMAEPQRSKEPNWDTTLASESTNQDPDKKS